MVDIQTLCRCACVCRSWKHITEDPELRNRVDFSSIRHLYVCLTVFCTPSHLTCQFASNPPFPISPPPPPLLPPPPSLPTSVRDNHLKRLLQKYRPLIGHLNLRGCSQLTTDSIRAISTTPVSLPFLLSSPFLPPFPPPSLSICTFLHVQVSV